METLGTFEGQNFHLASHLEPMLDESSHCSARSPTSGPVPFVRPRARAHPTPPDDMCFRMRSVVLILAVHRPWKHGPLPGTTLLQGLVASRKPESVQGKEEHLGELVAWKIWKHHN